MAHNGTDGHSEEINEASLRLHGEAHGKIGTALKVPIENASDLSLAYTPGVAAVSRALFADPSRARELTITRNTVAVLTDGSAVLGLGNVGPLAALPVMEGKAALFKRLGGVDAFPICLDTQDTEEIIRTAKLIAPVFGGINLEDISAPRCFEIEARLKAELSIPVFHDDQHGSAVVVLAALINALRVRKRALNEARIVINGAGAAGNAIANLLLEYGASDLTVCDSKGVIGAHRTDLDHYKKKISGRTNPRSIAGGLADALREADVFVGVSKANLLAGDMIRSMRPNPIIFALANPVPEIMPDTARAAGALIIATGRSDFPNQINNVLAFPGIFRGALDNGVREITTPMLIEAARTLAGLVSSPHAGQLLPMPFDPRVVPAVASAIH